MDIAHLIFPAFIAGMLTFLAPCTLPLVPAYLSFISGVALKDLRDPYTGRRARQRIFLNGVLYVVGFSVVFVALGSVVAWGGSFLQERFLAARVGGVFIVLFGLSMLPFVRMPWPHFFQGEWLRRIVSVVRPGHPLAALLFGAIFALGWTPCVGPVLGAVLTLAATTATVSQGAWLLVVFSAGLGLPFLMVAASIGWFSRHIREVAWIGQALSFVGGVFLIFLGILIATNSLGVWISYFFKATRFIGYDGLLEYL